MQGFLVLWSTQSLSQLGSQMTSFALLIWVYQQSNSALASALLAACTYAPYICSGVLMSAVVDRCNVKVVMVLCDGASALCTIAIVVLYAKGSLELPYLYALSAVSGFMGSLQQPASEVAISAVTTTANRQRAGGLRSLSYAVNTMLVPLLATALLSAWGFPTVVVVDLTSFVVASVCLMTVVRIPVLNVGGTAEDRESYGQALLSAWTWLRGHRDILKALLFMAAINLFASMDDAALTPMVLSRTGSQHTLGIVNATAGLAMLVGAIIVTLSPRPADRMHTMILSMLCSFGTGNMLLALPLSLPWWCVGIACCWVAVPIEMTNQDAMMRDSVPLGMQGRVYAFRNALQYATIPCGSALAGWLIDRVFTPMMGHAPRPGWGVLFTGGAGGAEDAVNLDGGQARGAGAGMMLMVDGLLGVLLCLCALYDHRRAAGTAAM
jgi:hypothetical protein